MENNFNFTTLSSDMILFNKYKEDRTVQGGDN